MMQPGEVIVAGMFFATVGAVTYPLARAVARRIEARVTGKGALPEAAVERIARMETTLESVAIEVERISEGQRFVTKLLADKHDDGRLPPGGASR